MQSFKLHFLVHLYYYFINSFVQTLNKNPCKRFEKKNEYLSQKSEIVSL